MEASAEGGDSDSVKIDLSGPSSLSSIDRRLSERIHDYFNLAITGVMAVMTVGSLTVRRAWNLPLAVLMVGYLIVDSIWIVLFPQVSGGSDGGGAGVLIAHHVLAATLAAHAASWALHRHYTSWMSVVEINTLILMVKKNLPKFAMGLEPLIHMTFVGSWVATRLVWFPILGVHLCIMSGYPSLGRRLVCGACIVGLTVLQFLWTWNFVVPEEKRVALQ